MRPINIIIRNSSSDTFDVKAPKATQKIILPVYRNSAAVSTNIFELLEVNGFDPVNSVFDLINLSLAVYTIDQTVSREQFGYLGWSRHFNINLPVSNLSIWNKQKDDLEKLLSFLSGDKWQITFRKSKLDRVTKARLITNPDAIDKVSLFSGGLDSFVGAIDLLEQNNKVAFVSHYKRGSESPTQTELYKLLEKKYTSTAFRKHKFYVQPNQHGENVTKESSSRARSFLFLCLGITIANCLDEKIKLIVPENGLISLNIPLTGTRISSHSTRTTHPYYMSLFRSFVKNLGINNPIATPYQFLTKGEMMKECLNKDFLKKTYSESLSCSHPEISRLVKGAQPGLHCGYCVPCIIRQAAEKKAGYTKTFYSFDIKKNPPEGKLQKGRDLKAFKMALEKFKKIKPQSLVLQVLRSGPLPFQKKEELDAYINLYKRGMKEVEQFLK